MSFNSKLVRLKGAPSAGCLSPVESRFQFQTGAIKRYIRENVDALMEGFNSKLVRLKAETDMGIRGFGKCVSIPNWCD